MTRDEFAALPPSIALGLMWDQSSAMRAALEKIEVPKVPRPPKFDQPIYRKGGVQWASETDLDGLRYWHDRNAESALSGGEYAEKNAKTAKNLEYWITWRAANPAAQWSGERFHEQVTAAPPSSKPAVHERGARAAAPQAPPSAPAFDDDSGMSDEDIPF